MTLSEFQIAAEKSDRTGGRDLEQFQYLLLGLFGEVGSLLSALKRNERDSVSRYLFEKQVQEELGDTLWYFVTIATHADLAARDLVELILENDAKSDFSEPSLNELGELVGERGDAITVSLRLASAVGELLIDAEDKEGAELVAVLRESLPKVLSRFLDGVLSSSWTLEEIARQNLEKTSNRWPDQEVTPQLFDNEFREFEKLPRRFKVFIREETIGNEKRVYQSIGEVTIGNSLDDNHATDDDYRFHDVLHLSFAAVLGWSPVLRSLLKAKRKSDPEVDRTQDGARAIVLEEGISTMIFNHAKLLDFYKDADNVEFPLLKMVKNLVEGFEVEAAPFWLWQKAILDGFAVFRELKKYRRGYINVNLEERSIKFESYEDVPS